MAALAQDTARASRNRGIEAYVKTDAVTYFVGAFVGLDTTTGKVVLWTDVANRAFLGVVMQHYPLSDYGITTTSPDEVQVNTSGEILEYVSVATASAITDVGAAVYATSDNDLTLAVASNTNAVGRVVRWYSSTFCDVRLFTPAEYLLQ